MNYPNIIILLLLCCLGLSLISCLTNSEGNNPSNQLLLTFELTNINNEIVAEGDTINVLSLRFLYGRTTLQNKDNDTLLVNENVFQITHQITNDETKGLANGTFDSDKIFSSLAFEIKKAEQLVADTENNFDVDAFIEGDSDDQRYSMIINGSYNNNEFEFKSTRNFNFEFPIEDGSDSNQENLLYNLPLKTDVQQWFLNSEGDGLLDPRSGGNASAINDNIQQSVKIN